MRKNQPKPVKAAGGGGFGGWFRRKGKKGAAAAKGGESELPVSDIASIKSLGEGESVVGDLEEGGLPKVGLGIIKTSYQRNCICNCSGSIHHLRGESVAGDLEEGGLPKVRLGSIISA